MSLPPPLPPPLPLEEAQARLLADIAPLGSEVLATGNAQGRYLAGPLEACRTQPAADLSAMDGYAMRADDLAGPWQLVGESAAGHPFARALGHGEAIRISTGALMPQSGGAVLLQENARRDGDLVHIAEGAPSPRHIRKAGFDFCSGDPLIGTGTLLTTGRIALALAAGHAALVVGRLPSLAVLDSGDELSADPAACAPHQIPASNGPMLAAMAAPLCGPVRRLGPVPDQMDAMLMALDAAQDYDVLVTSGGASVGDHDLVRPALETWGAEIAFWRVAIKPGKPLMVARKGRQMILGLPGNPVSSYVTAFLFLLPLLRKLGGAADPLPRAIRLPLLEAMPDVGSRMEFVRAVIGKDGVTPLGQQDSSALASLSLADCLIQRPAHAPAAEIGESAAVFLL